MFQDMLHSDGPNSRLGPAKPRDVINKWGYQHGLEVLVLTHAGLQRLAKGANPDFATGCLLHNGGERQKSMDMPCKGIQRNVHRIFLERCGVN